METKNDWELQEWQREILENFKTYGTLFKDEEERFELLPEQRRMLETILSDEYFISDEKIRETLEAVLELEFYYERDKKILNLVRGSYLRGENWIKRSYR